MRPAIRIEQAIVTALCAVVVVWLTIRLVRNRGKAALPPRTPYPVRWDLMDVAVVVVLYLVMNHTCNLALALLLGRGSITPLQAGKITVGCQISVNITIVFYVFQVVFRSKKHAAEALGLSSKNLLRNCGRGVAGYVIYCPMMMISARFVRWFLSLDWTRHMLSHPHVEWIMRMTGISKNVQAPVETLLETQSIPLLVMLSAFAVVVAPLAEEIFFRGFLQQAVRRRYGEFATIAITAVIFASVHMNLRYFVPLAVLGVLLSYLYERTGTLVAPVVVHTLHNATTIAALLIKKYGNAS